MAQAAIVLAKGLVAIGANAAIAKFAATVFVYAASAYLLNRASKALAPKQRAAGTRGADINYYDTGASLRIVYGRVRSGGMETIPPILGGLKSENLHKVVTLAGHEIDSYNYIHFDTNTISTSQIGPMTFTSSDGAVISGVYSGHAYIRRYRGTSTDSLDRILLDTASSAFANFRGRGIAKTALTFVYNEKIYGNVPDTTFTYQGKRCYDPRLDVTPGASPTNASYIAWTRNPALCLVDYLMGSYGGGYTSADIDWDTVVTAANYCDGSVSVPTAATQARYTCNGVLLAAGNNQFEENVKALVDSMLGRVIFRDGKWRVYAGSWKTPDFTVQKADWISGLSIRFEQGKKRRFNRMRTWYIDPNREWQRCECFPRSSATYVTADKGEAIDAETEQLLCTEEYEAQRKGEFLLRQSRNQITVAGRLPPRFQDIALWDTGTIVFDHLGWSSKTFRAVSLDVNEDGSIDGVFAEEQSSDWTDLAEGEYNTFSVSPIPPVNVTNPSEPRSFTVTPQINGSLLFNWDTPIINPAGTMVQIIRSTNSSDASVGTVVYEGVARPVALTMPVSRHWYWSRAVTPSSAFSPYQPNTFGLFAVSRLEADQTLQQRLVGDAEMEYGTAASLWQMTNFFVHSAGHLEIGSATGVESITYFATGGQYAGYINITRATPNSLSLQPVLIATNLSNSLGHAFNGRPTAIEYSVRLRCNSNGGNPTALVNLMMVERFATPNSPNGLYARNAFTQVTSAMVGVTGQWVSLKLYAVMEPTQATTPLGQYYVNSTNEHYMRPALYTTIGMDVDVDYFQATNLGHVNYPVVHRFASLEEVYERNSMRNVMMVNCSGVGQVTFPASASPVDADWRKWPVGRSFCVTKGHTMQPVYVNPASGMALHLAGRTATGTVTMQQSLSARAIIEKISEVDFLVEGSGLV